MERYYFNNKEVHINDTLVITSKSLYGGVQRTFVRYIPLTKGLLKVLLDEGIITKEGENHVSEGDNHIFTSIIERIGKRNKWTREVTENTLKNITHINPVLTFWIYLKELSILFDKKYPDHISDSPEIYTVSLVSGRIIKVNKEFIKNYANFAAFRSKEEAKKAIELLGKLYESSFIDVKKK